jgi:glucose-6-phosphate isomerase
MVEAIASLIESRAWKVLEVHAAVNRNLHLRDIFAQDPKRGVRLKVEAVGIYLDYSKNRIIDETVALLLQLAVESSLHPRIDAMFRGEKINVTEKRAVLHVPLRSPEEEEIFAERVNVVPQDSEGALA